MNVIRHHNRSVQSDALSVIVQTMLQNYIAGWLGEWIAVELAECHEACPVRLLIMRQPAPVLVFSIENVAA